MDRTCKFTVQTQQSLLDQLPPTPDASEDFSLPIRFLNDVGSNSKSIEPFYLANIFQGRPKTPEKAPDVVRKKDPGGTKLANLPCARRSWKIGSILEIYSRTYKSWFTGEIRAVGFDEEGEFCEVHYTNHNNGKNLIKYLSRYDKHLRPITRSAPILQTPTIRPNIQRKKNQPPRKKPPHVPKRNSIRKTHDKKSIIQCAIELADQGFNYQSSRGSETVDQSVKLELEDDDDDFEEKVLCLDFDDAADALCEDLRDDSPRLGWLDSSEFETFFKCRLSVFLKRIEAYE